MRYFIGIVSKEHVMLGVKMGIAQIGHGKRSGLARMQKGDWIIYYSPKIALDSKIPLKAFTALGQMRDDDIYQVEESPTFKPFRRKVKYEKVKDAPITPLIEKLIFIKNKKSWDYVFRFGLVEIPKEDFDLISNTMLGKI
ncbi:MAG TPA: EVE domain-containing protein [Candidatus Limnocylindrales bacterium]|nr:EVE domain-containing protein [Candidatus Limnocylindrales bacterium]